MQTESIDAYLSEISTRLTTDPDQSIPLWLHAATLRLVLSARPMPEPIIMPPPSEPVKTPVEPETALPDRPVKRRTWSPEARAAAADRMRLIQARRHGKAVDGTVGTFPDGLGGADDRSVSGDEG